MLKRNLFAIAKLLVTYGHNSTQNSTYIHLPSKTVQQYNNIYQNTQAGCHRGEPLLAIHKQNKTAKNTLVLKKRKIKSVQMQMREHHKVATITQ